MSNLQKNLIAIAILMASIVGFVYMGVNIAKKNKTQSEISVDCNMEDSFGRAYYSTGSTGAVTTSATEPTLLKARNTGRVNFLMTNIGTESVQFYRQNFSGTTTASVIVSRTGGGLYLGANGGSYETGENDEGQSFTWIGDFWVSTTSVPVIITYEEKTR